MAGLSVTVKMMETEEFKKVHEEIDKLATFILQEFPDEPGRIGESESAVDVAIRLLKESFNEVNIVDSNNELVASVGRTDIILQNGYRIASDEVVNLK